ncbi:MAG TPA: hypothetical protein VLD62_06500, partial [Acidimicrobiia bacterium]|nr:hypothetical protein [Acidimicrobiia bacterium]
MGGGILEIRLLGGFEIRRRGVVQKEIPSLAARSLIAYLAMNPDRLPTRDLIAGTFWPDRSDAEARVQLRQALWHAGNTIGTGA